MLLARHEKWEVADKPWPAPVDPVMPVVYTDSSSPAFASGSRPN